MHGPVGVARVAADDEALVLDGHARRRDAQHDDVADTEPRRRLDPRAALAEVDGLDLLDLRPPTDAGERRGQADRQSFVAAAIRFDHETVPNRALPDTGLPFGVHRRTRLAVILVVAMAACSSDGGADDAPAARPAPSGSFRSLTYNVAGLPQGINPDQFPERNQPLMSPLLNGYDVVLLQEDFGFYTDLLRADADHEHRSQPHPGPAVSNPIGREGVAVGDGLNVLSRLPIGDLDRVPWSTCAPASADCLALKGFAATTLTLAEDVTVELVTLHLEAGGDPADDAARGADLDELAAYLDARAPDRAVIVGGDWNLRYRDEPDGTQLRTFLDETRLQDVCDVLDCGADADVIDRFVFRSGGGVTLSPTRHAFERATFVDATGAPLSDHDPLAVDWVWSASPATAT